MRRVAEIVMVLAVAGEVRGGREPTAAERALAAKARERLAAAVAEGAARPKDLFPGEAVRAVVEDLGLNRARDPAAMGFRPPKASIADRLILTKRKGYILVAGGAIRNFSPAFGKLKSTEQHLEGEYRQLHSRLRTHAESVAFYGGEKREASHIMQRFEALVGHLKHVLHENWWFGMIQDFFLKYFGATVAVVLIIEPFFSGDLRPDSSTLGRADMLSNLRYHTSVIISLFQSLGTLSISSRRLNILSGYADRIRELLDVSRELSGVRDRSLNHNSSAGNYISEANHIEFSGVKVVTPAGNVLVEDLTLRVEKGSNLLITA